MSNLTIPAVALVQAYVVHVLHLFDQSRREERGQATAEYALVLLGVAAVALLVVTWAARTNRIGNLLNTVFDRIRGRVG